MYLKWPSKPSILSRVSPGHLYYLFLDILPTYFQKVFCKKKDLDTRKSGNLKIQKPRFTNRSPEEVTRQERDGTLGGWALDERIPNMHLSKTVLY